MAENDVSKYLTVNISEKISRSDRIWCVEVFLTFSENVEKSLHDCILGTTANKVRPI